MTALNQYPAIRRTYFLPSGLAAAFASGLAAALASGFATLGIGRGGFTLHLLFLDDFGLLDLGRGRLNDFLLRSEDAEDW